MAVTDEELQTLGNQVHMCLAAQRTDTTVHLDTARVCPQRRALFCLEVPPSS